MKNPEKIDLLKVRTISSILSDTFLFIKVNFKSFFSGIFYICTPVLLLFSICNYIFLSNYFNIIFPTLTGQMSQYYSASDLSKDLPLLIAYILLALATSFLVISFVITVSLSYIKLYKNNEDISIPILWKLTRKYIGKVMGSQLIVIVAVFIIYAICLLPILMGFIGVLFSLLLFFISIIGIFYLFIKLLFVHAFIILENKGIMESFKLSYQFTRGIFWNSILFVLIIGMITYLLNYLFQLPGIIIIYFNLLMGFFNQNSESSFYTILGTVIPSLLSAIGFVVYSIFYIGLSIFYYSTVESRTGIASSMEIDTIGKTEDFD